MVISRQYTTYFVIVEIWLAMSIKMLVKLKNNSNDCKDINKNEEQIHRYIHVEPFWPFQEPQPLINGPCGGHHAHHHLNAMPANCMYAGEEYAYQEPFYQYMQPSCRPDSSGSSCSSSNGSDRMALAHQAGGGGYTPPATMLMATAGHDDHHAAAAAAAAYQVLTPVPVAVGHGHHHGVIIDAQQYTVVNEYVHWYGSHSHRVPTITFRTVTFPRCQDCFVVTVVLQAPRVLGTRRSRLLNSRYT